MVIRRGGSGRRSRMGKKQTKREWREEEEEEWNGLIQEDFTVFVFCFLCSIPEECENEKVINSPAWR